MTKSLLYGNNHETILFKVTTDNFSRYHTVTRKPASVLSPQLISVISHNSHGRYLLTVFHIIFRCYDITQLSHKSLLNRTLTGKISGTHRK
jgi:hypothetical protein